MACQGGLREVFRRQVVNLPTPTEEGGGFPYSHKWTMKSQLGLKRASSRSRKPKVRPITSQESVNSKENVYLFNCTTLRREVYKDLSRLFQAANQSLPSSVTRESGPQV